MSKAEPTSHFWADDFAISGGLSVRSSSVERKFSKACSFVAFAFDPAVAVGFAICRFEIAAEIKRNRSFANEKVLAIDIGRI
jgi:hypothetical protein